ncbi:MAG: DNA/RNA nuclease SfsA, partial [Nitrospinota bacterium]|nr:DNA/RNA nuclease SfsA [Nitrospinota bacterium]
MIRKVNRFLAEVTVDGRQCQAHIPNSGRLAELMTPGRKVILERATNPERKTPFTLKSVHFKNRWVCIDSTTPNALAEYLARKQKLPLFDGYSHVRREVTMGAHRFDLRLDGEGMRPMIVEVKSVTLVKNGVAMFPDAPTKRGA